jgi:hypothetical protein
MNSPVSGHGGSGGLCWDTHTCPSCERGQPCEDLFVSDHCGLLVACSTPLKPEKKDDQNG